MNHVNHNLCDLYNTSYQKFTPSWFESRKISEIQQFLDENSESLRLFFEEVKEREGLSISDYRILEAGCGTSALSLWLTKLCPQIVAADLSPMAISVARSFAHLLQRPSLNYRVLDLRDAGSFNSKSFDLIIDSHLLHCLTLPKDRSSYLKNIFHWLDDGGEFLLETMVLGEEFRTPLGYYFDGEVLYKQNGQQEIPYRKIAHAREIENEVQSIGFKIKSLFYHSELSFEVYPEEADFPFKYLPKTLRVTLTK